jgi:Protein of unknown function (DUF2808)
MKKTLICAAIFILANVLLLSTLEASANDDNGTFPHLDESTSFPPHRSDTVRYTFIVHIPKNTKAMSQLIIKVPEVITVRKKNTLEIVDGNGQKMNTNVSINGQTILLTFPEPVNPNSKLEIDIKNVKRPTLGNGPIYRLSAKLVGSDAEIPVGLARFRF